MSEIAIYGTLVGAFLGTVGLIEFCRRKWTKYKAGQAALIEVEKARAEADRAEMIAKIVAPLEIAVRQLTQNGGKNNPATVPDIAHKVDELALQMRDVKDHLTRQDTRMDSSEVRAEQWRDEHRAWSDQKIAALTDRMRRFESRDE